MELSDENWEECLHNVHKCSVSVRHNLIQFKILDRPHCSQEKLHRFYPAVSPMCNQCKSTLGNHSHSFCTCSKLHCYWKSIFHCFSEVFGKSLVPCSLIVVLGAASVLPSTNKHDKKAIQFGMVIERTDFMFVENGLCTDMYLMAGRNVQHTISRETKAL